eukprot:3938590-Rhodomonas_salina.9
MCLLHHLRRSLAFQVRISPPHETVAGSNRASSNAEPSCTASKGRERSGVRLRAERGGAAAGEGGEGARARGEDGGGSAREGAEEEGGAASGGGDAADRRQGEGGGRRGGRRGRRKRARTGQEEVDLPSASSFGVCVDVWSVSMSGTQRGSVADAQADWRRAAGGAARSVGAGGRSRRSRGGGKEGTDADDREGAQACGRCARRICGVAMRCVWHQGDVAMLSIRLWLPSV